MTVREDEIERADGSRGVYGVVEKADYALVIPCSDNGFVLVEQFRYPVGRRYWEFPQGSWDREADVPPEDLARAELAEETGYHAGAMRHLGRVFCAYGFCNQGCQVFAADDLTPGPPARDAGEQGMRMATFTAEEVERMIRTGAIADAPSIAGYGLLRLV